MLSFIAQSKYTGQQFDIEADNLMDAKEYLDSFVGDPQDYIIHVSGVHIREAREIAEFKERIEKQYRKDIENYRNAF